MFRRLLTFIQPKEKKKNKIAKCKGLKSPFLKEFHQWFLLAKRFHSGTSESLSSGIQTQRGARWSVPRAARVKDTGVISPVIAILDAANGTIVPATDHGARVQMHTLLVVVGEQAAAVVMQAAGMLSCRGSFGRLRFDDSSYAMGVAKR